MKRSVMTQKGTRTSLTKLHFRHSGKPMQEITAKDCNTKELLCHSILCVEKIYLYRKW